MRIRWRPAASCHGISPAGWAQIRTLRTLPAFPHSTSITHAPPAKSGDSTPNGQSPPKANSCQQTLSKRQDNSSKTHGSTRRFTIDDYFCIPVRSRINDRVQLRRLAILSQSWYGGPGAGLVPDRAGRAAEAANRGGSAYFPVAPLNGMQCAPPGGTQLGEGWGMASRARGHRGIAVRRVGRWLRGHRRLALTGFSVLVAAGGIVVPALPAAAATGTTVALTFDNNTLSQYALGFQQALQPHSVNATFYVSSGSVSNSSSTKYMSWSQLSALSAAGNDIGGKTVDGTSLTTLTAQQQISEICTDQQNLAQHGLRPDTFAYPGGAFNTTIEAEVQSCGYGNARTAGSLSPTGTLYAETLPPKTWLALRAYAPTGQISLSNLESLVSGAVAHGGGWVPIVIGKVCSQTLDPANYSTCTASSGWIDLGDLNTFLNWVQSAGQSGGAPTGTAFNTMQGTALSADAVAPTTAIFCGGSPCASTTYTSTVSVSLAATDFGSGVARTHYTTDGTTPTLTSPAYTGAFPLTSTTTVQFRSWDAAGNAEA